MDYTERLRRLSVYDAELTDDLTRVDADVASGTLDQKSLELARLAALVAVGGAASTFGAQADAAISAGGSPTEIVDTIIGLVPVIGLPRVVDAAPHLAMALGFDTDDMFEPE